MQSYAKRYIFYKNCNIWCYSHKRFEDMKYWMDHNSDDEFIAIQESLLPRYIVRCIGGIEFMILLREGIITTDRIIDKELESILCNTLLILLKKEGYIMNLAQTS